MRKTTIALTGLTLATALTLAGCGQAPEESAGPSASAPGASDFKACLVSDAGGWDDKSFNQSAKEGLDRAVADLGVQSATAESKADSDYAPNVESMVQQGCQLTIGVGFLLEQAIEDAAKANTDVEFGLLDSTFSDESFNPITIDNAKPLVFNTAEAAYLAGYVAAGTTKTGTVATFGGQEIPSVTVFMDGFVDGVARYNKDSGKDVKVLGWDKAAQNGSFTGNFDDQAAGQTLTEGFIAQKADIIMPVAGPVGLGAAAAAEKAGDTYIIGVDSDWYESTEYGDIVITSVLKEIDAAVYDTVKAASSGSFSNAPYVGTLSNGGVGIAPFHDFDAQVPADVKTAVESIQQEIIDGTTTVESQNSPQQ